MLILPALLIRILGFSRVTNLVLTYLLTTRNICL